MQLSLKIQATCQTFSRRWANSALPKRQTAAAAYFSSKQLLLFAFALANTDRVRFAWQTKHITCRHIPSSHVSVFWVSHAANYLVTKCFLYKYNLCWLNIEDWWSFVHFFTFTRWIIFQWCNRLLSNQSTAIHSCLLSQTNEILWFVPHTASYYMG